MNIFGIGLPEMAVIAAIGLLVFGPKRLPELGKTLGRTLRGFQSASQEFEKEFRNAISDDATQADTTALAPGEIDPGETVTVESSASTAPSSPSPKPPVAAGETASS
jgi:sec-independent protein translocase protein TatA